MRSDGGETTGMELWRRGWALELGPVQLFRMLEPGSTTAVDGPGGTKGKMAGKEEAKDSAGQGWEASVVWTVRSPKTEVCVGDCDSEPELKPSKEREGFSPVQLWAPVFGGGGGAGSGGTKQREPPFPPPREGCPVAAATERSVVSVRRRRRWRTLENRKGKGVGWGADQDSWGWAPEQAEVLMEAGVWTRAGV